ncbi:single-stranded DNA-binding protein [Musca domestica]|uniref:Single-stranded DNA-binding protein n=1 Tax=Musca domestica TaxID=7370 RepID=A0A9J7I6M6_MUSDO|nr:single-stranded DNA-binding protein [Musca domestica]
MKQKFTILLVTLVVALMFEAVLSEDGSGGESGPDGGYHYEHHGDNSYGYGWSDNNGGGGSSSGSGDQNDGGFDWGWLGQWFHRFGKPQNEPAHEAAAAPVQE